MKSPTKNILLFASVLLLGVFLLNFASAYCGYVTDCGLCPNSCNCALSYCDYGLPQSQCSAAGGYWCNNAHGTYCGQQLCGNGCDQPNPPNPPTGAGVGYVDSLTNCVFTGWARDNSDLNFKSTVHLYIDGQAGVSPYGMNIGLADAPREPAVGVHGFNSVRASLTAYLASIGASTGHGGTTHTVYGYSWDRFGNLYTLSNFPKTFTIPIETCNGADDDCDGVVDNGLKINGGWSGWSGWSNAGTCGEFNSCKQRQLRVRTCNNPSPFCGGASCPGENSEIQDLNCGTINGGWSGFGSCSNTCGTGTQTRTCNNPFPSCGGAQCSGSSTQSCTSYSSCTYSWQYGSWSLCSTTCGTGTQTRSASCLRSDGTTVADSFCGTPTLSQTCTDTSGCPLTLPIINITSPINVTYNTTSVLLNATSNQIVTLKYSLNGAANITFTPAIAITAIEGSNGLFVYGTNSNGTGQAYVLFNVNTTQINQTNGTIPIITIISPTNGTYNTTLILLNATSTQTGMSWNYSLNGNANISFTPGIDNLTLGNGTYNLLIYGTNVNGTGFDTVNFVINTSSNGTIVYTYSWETDSWSSCSGGERDRDVWCQRNDIVNVSDSFCSGIAEPADTDDCGSGGSSNNNQVTVINNSGKNLVIINQTTTSGVISLLNGKKSLSLTYKNLLWLLVFFILLLLLIILIILLIRSADNSR